MMTEAVALLEILGPFVGRALDAYQKARELAAKAGVTEEDLQAADARFLKVYTDPLAGETKPPEPTPEPKPEPPTPMPTPTPLHYWQAYPIPVPNDTFLKASKFKTGDAVQVSEDERMWRVIDIVVGGMGWKFLREIG